jgi:hypothetical protein
MMLLRGCERITTPLGKIEFKMLIFLNLNVQILFFIILNNNLFLLYRLCDFWNEAQKIKKYTQEISLPG